MQGVWDRSAVGRRRRWQYGIAVIVWRLKARRVPSKRSMTYETKQTLRGGWTGLDTYGADPI